MRNHTLQLAVYQPQAAWHEFTTFWIIQAYSHVNALVSVGRVYQLPELGRSLAASRARQGRSVTV